MRRAIAIAALSVLALTPAVRSADSILVTSRARAVQPGELVVLTLTTTTPADSLRVRVFNRESAAYRVDERTWRALVGIDLDVAAGVYSASIDGRAGAETMRTT